jgi:hypothetical protein
MKNIFLFAIIAFIIKSTSVNALDLNDRIQFFDHASKREVSGRVCEISRNPETREKIILIKLDGSKKIVQAPRGQYLVLESSLLKAVDRDRKKLNQQIIRVPKSLILNQYCFNSPIESLFKQVSKKIIAESEFWSRFESIVFLSEGGDERWEGKSDQVPLASALHEMFPRIQIIKTDLDKKNAFSKDGKVAEFCVNNTHAFAESVTRVGGKKDALIMLRGLCHCGTINQNESFVCGGIDTANLAEMTKFLRQVLAVVDWTKTHAFAYLEGVHHDFRFNFMNEGKEIPETDRHFKSRLEKQERTHRHWQKALLKAIIGYDVNAEIDYSPEGQFRGILFTTRNS